MIRTTPDLARPGGSPELECDMRIRLRWRMVCAASMAISERIGVLLEDLLNVDLVGMQLVRQCLRTGHGDKLHVLLPSNPFIFVSGEGVLRIHHYVDDPDGVGVRNRVSHPQRVVPDPRAGNEASKA